MKFTTSLAIVIALAVAGCGGGSDESTPSHDLVALRAVCDVVYENVEAESLPPDAKTTIITNCNSSGSANARRIAIGAKAERVAEAKGALQIYCSQPAHTDLRGCQEFREKVAREGR